MAIQIKIKEYKEHFSRLKELGFIPIKKFESSNDLYWMRAINLESNIYSYFYITKLRGTSVRFEFVVAPPIYLDSLPELVSCCFYQELGCHDFFSEQIIQDILNKIELILFGERSLAEMVSEELKNPSFCTYRRLKPHLTTCRYLIHLRRFELALNSPWLDSYIEKFNGKTKNLSKVIPIEHEQYFSEILLKEFHKEFEQMNGASKEAALDEWTAYFLVEYLTANRII